MWSESLTDLASQDRTVTQYVALHWGLDPWLPHWSGGSCIAFSESFWKRRPSIALPVSHPTCQAREVTAFPAPISSAGSESDEWDQNFGGDHHPFDRSGSCVSCRFFKNKSPHLQSVIPTWQITPHHLLDQVRGWAPDTHAHIEPLWLENLSF